PMMTDKMVAISPATKATRTVLRPPHRSGENTSCGCWVVPSQCAAEGGCGKLAVVEKLRLGLYGAIHGPIAATRRNTPSMPRPMSTFGDLASGNRGPRQA